MIGLAITDTERWETFAPLAGRLDGGVPLMW